MNDGDIERVRFMIEQHYTKHFEINLRDNFALQSMSALLSSIKGDCVSSLSEIQIQNIVTQSYKIADMMIKSYDMADAAASELMIENEELRAQLD